MFQFSLAVLSTIICTISQVALAEGPLSLKANSISEKLSAVENQLTPRDSRYTAQALEDIESILRNYDTPADKIICASNGETGSYERFAPFYQGQAVGGWTQKNTCNELIKNTKSLLICSSNGETGSYERFAVTDLRMKTALGGKTRLETCFQVLKAEHDGMLCLSNGETGSYERFQLFDRHTNKAIGGYTSLENCISSLGQ